MRQPAAERNTNVNPPTVTPPERTDDLSLTGPAMKAAWELAQRGLIRGRTIEIARIIDQFTTLPELVESLIGIAEAVRVGEFDDRELRKFVFDVAMNALSNAEYEFTYLDDGGAYLRRAYDNLAAFDRQTEAAEAWTASEKSAKSGGIKERRKPGPKLSNLR
jgi:hypothetical protein